MKLLSVESLRVWFPVRKRLFQRERRFVRAVDDVSFEIAEGETLGLVGESGCGKTTLSRALLRLIEPTSGRVRFKDIDFTALNRRDLRKERRNIQLVFQDPYRSLNPRMTVEAILSEPLRIHNLSKSPAARRARVVELLELVGLDPSHIHRYPHEFSGGQRQRIGIARALAVEPRLLVCDEPVSALDVSVQAQIINLLQDLQRARSLAYLFIAHDLAVIEHISDRLMVMYLGKIVETGLAKEICSAPRHPYTQALIAAVPAVQNSIKTQPPLAADPPSPILPPTGCPFHPRCPIASERCTTEVPPFRFDTAGSGVACHHV